MSQRKNSPLSSIWLKLLLAVISACSTLLILEIMVRFLPPPYSLETGQMFTCDPNLGWIGTPNFDGMFEGPNFKQRLNFNSTGMHDTEHSRSKSANTFRILMLGDSFVQAIQVGETETAHQILENQLNHGAAGKSYEVISGGVVNWGTNQQLVYYREQGRNLNPNLVLLLFYIGNDFADNLPGNGLTIKGFNCYAPYFALCGDKLSLSPLAYAPGLSRIEGNCSPWRRWLINVFGWLYQHSRLYQQLEPLLATHWPRETFGQSYPLSYAALYLPDNEAELEAAWQVTEATITQLRQEVEADGARFAIVIIPPWSVVQLALLSPAEQEVFLQANSQFAQAKADRPNRRLAHFLDSQTIPFIDLTDQLVAYSAAHARIPLYITGEGHWTVEGNRVVADILAQWLIENDFTLDNTKP